MKELDENASLQEVITKINEIIKYINGNSVPIMFDEKNIPLDIRDYLIENGGMIKS